MQARHGLLTARTCHAKLRVVFVKTTLRFTLFERKIWAIPLPRRATPGKNIFVAVAPSCLGPLLPALVLPAVFLVAALRAPMLARPLMDANSNQNHYETHKNIHNKCYLLQNGKVAKFIAHFPKFNISDVLHTLRNLTLPCQLLHSSVISPLFVRFNSVVYLCTVVFISLTFSNFYNYGKR